MSIKERVEIQQFKFNPTLFNTLLDEFPPVKDNWPIVYILISETKKKAYVGQTAKTFTRFKAHLKDGSKKKLSKVYLVYHNKTNKSLIEDLESFLIKVIHGDGRYAVLNGNGGLKESGYYQQHKHFPALFEKVWKKLMDIGVAKNSLKYIINAPLFKYSPYKTLGKEQKQGLLKILTSLLDPKAKHVVIEGGAGTGKSVLAIFVFKLLNTPIDEFNYDSFEKEGDQFLQLVRKLQQKYNDPEKMALVIPMSSFRKSIQRAFGHVEGLTGKMVISPGQAAIGKYDLLITDEAHRLRRYKNLGQYFNSFKETCRKLKLDKDSCSELDWITQHSAKSVFFYDEEQSIKPSDTRREDFIALKATAKIERLTAQFRVQGGKKYISFVKKLLSCKLPNYKKIRLKSYQFLLYNDIRGFVNQIMERNASYDLSRLTAGYAWKWVSEKKGTRHLYDIKINGVRRRWNGTRIDWINSGDAHKEVGCIHTVQGYDLNYAGVILGPEISYDKEKNKVIIFPGNYHDRYGKNGIKDPEELKRYIINIYKTLMLRGVKGTFLYACDKDLSAYLARHIPVADTIKS